MFFFFFENCQNEEDAAVLEKSGFSRITVLPLTGLKVGNVKITRIPAQHGTYKNCGEAMGVMFSAETEAKLYLTHMDNVAHASVTRFTMRGQLTAYGVSNYDMLEDGGSVVY